MSKLLGKRALVTAGAQGIGLAISRHLLAAGCDVFTHYRTSAEAALLQLFAANAGHPFSRSDLCSRLGVALERSIDVQVTRLRRKIEEDPKLPLYLQTVRGIGYVLVPDRS